MQNHLWVQNSDKKDVDNKQYVEEGIAFPGII